MRSIEQLSQLRRELLASILVGGAVKLEALGVSEWFEFRALISHCHLGLSLPLSSQQRPRIRVDFCVAVFWFVVVKHDYFSHLDGADETEEEEEDDDDAKLPKAPPDSPLSQPGDETLRRGPAPGDSRQQWQQAAVLSLLAEA